MQQSLFTGLTGLKANQTYLDVIGDNLANSETTAFKESRLVFGDLFAKTLSGGNAPQGTNGGVNPLQIGRGTRVQGIDPNLSQGVLVGTGRSFDLGIEGRGFFVVSSPGGGDFYTRAGAFGLDGSGNLVDTGSGLRVQGQGGDINIDVNAVLPPQSSSQIDFRGNLPATISGPTPEVLSSVSPMLEGTSASLSGDAGPYDLDDGSGEPMTLTLRVDDGATRTVTFDFAEFGDPNAATVDEVLAVIEAAVPEVSVANEGGAPVLRSSKSGLSSSLDIDDGRGLPASILGLSTTPARGDQFAASSTTPLNDLVSNATDYVLGDTINIEGQDADGGEVLSTFSYGTDGTTMGELVTFIQGLYPSSTVSLDDQGRLEVTANDTGESSLALTLKDSDSSTGQTRFEDNPFEVSVEGQGPDRVESAIEVFDSLGRGHTVLVAIERREGSVWDVNVTLPDEDGTVSDGQVLGVNFAEDGSIASIEDGNTNISLSFEGAEAQTLNLNLGEVGGFEGLTQFGEDSTASIVGQDGFPEGSLLSVGIQDEGQIRLFFDNGQTQDADQLLMATFTNAGALVREGDNLFAASANSGEVQIGIAGQEGVGAVRAGTLESSNVDLSQEFVRMIEAQRSFQANARIIQATDELLAEAVNLV